MKRILVGVVVAGLVVGGALMVSAGKDDTSVTEGALDSMSAEDLASADTSPVIHGPPDLTNAVVLAVVEDLKAGVMSHALIARKHGCSLGQVKLIIRKIKKRLQELAPEPQPIDVIP